MKYQITKKQIKTADIQGRSVRRAQHIEVTYSSQRYSAKDIDTQVSLRSQALRRLHKKGWYAIGVKVSGKWFTTTVSLDIEHPTPIMDLVYEYYDAYFDTKGEDNPFAIKDANKKSFDAFKIQYVLIPNGGQAGTDSLCFFHCLQRYHNHKLEEVPSFMFRHLHIPFKSPITKEHAIKLQERYHYNLHIEGNECDVYEPVNPNPTWAHYYLILKNGHWSVNKKKHEKYHVVFELENTGEADEELLAHGINMTKYHGFIHANQYNIMHHVNTLGLRIDEIPQWEHMWIKNSTRGGYCFCRPGTYSKGYAYDECKSYASILNDGSFRVPIKQGTLASIPQSTFDMTLEKHSTFKYGMYHVKVEPGNDKFPYNKLNTYAHPDLEIAVKEGLKMTVFEEESNAVLYNCAETTVPATQIFHPWIDKLWGIAQKIPKNKNVKRMLSSMWGSVSAMNHKQRDLEEMTDEDVCDNILTISDTENKYQTYDLQKIYKYPLARLKPFLLSKQRLRIYERLREHWSDIIYMRTDGAVLTHEIPCDSVKEMGAFLYEASYSDMSISNMNSMKVIKAQK